MHPKDLGIRIRQVRDKLEMTQAQFAEMTGVTRSATVSDWEHGREIPGADRLRIMAEAVGENAAYIFGVFGDSALRGGSDEEAFQRGLRAPLPPFEGEDADYLAGLSAEMRAATNGADHAPTAPTAPTWERVAASGGDGLQSLLSAEFRRINQLNCTDQFRMLERDSVGSLIGRAAVFAAEVAGKARADAMREAEINDRLRMEAGRPVTVVAPINPSARVPPETEEGPSLPVEEAG